MFDYFYIIFIILIGEGILTSIWFIPYYKKGIVIFNKSYNSTSQKYLDIPLLESLELPSIKYKQLSNTLIGFRGIGSNSLFVKRSAAFSHGIIYESEDSICIKGYLGIGPILLIMFISGAYLEDFGFSNTKAVIFMSVLILIVIIIIIQISRGRFEELYNHLKNKLDHN